MCYDDALYKFTFYVLTYLCRCDVVSGREAVRDRRARKDSVRRRSVWVADIERTAKTLDYNLINHVHTADVCNTINPQCIVLSSIRLLSFTNTVFCILPPQCLDAIIWTKELTAVKKYPALEILTGSPLEAIGGPSLVWSNMQKNRSVKQNWTWVKFMLLQPMSCFPIFTPCAKLRSVL